MTQPVRRVVTGLDAQGRARVLIDAPSPHVMEGPTGAITRDLVKRRVPRHLRLQG